MSNNEIPTGLLLPPDYIFKDEFIKLSYLKKHKKDWQKGRDIYTEDVWISAILMATFELELPYESVSLFCKSVKGLVDEEITYEKLDKIFLYLEGIERIPELFFTDNLMEELLDKYNYDTCPYIWHRGLHYSLLFNYPGN